MPKRGGQTTQSGILYQNSVAALFLGLLCDSRERPQEKQALQIRVESPDNVDDIVVTFADQHRLFIQAKENINPSDIIWKELWHNFEEEYFQQDFRRELDFLQFQVGTERAVIRDLHEVCERALTSTKPTEWKNSLSKKQLGLLEKVKSILSPRLWDDDAILMFFKHIKVEIWTLTYIEDDLVNDWMPESNKSPIHLFRLLRDRVGGEARRGGSFIAADLRRSITEEVKDFIFLDAPDIEVLKQKIKSISSVLHQHKNTWGQTGIHLRRSISHEIALWLSRNKIDSTNNVDFLVDQAGMGKTVVMRDILAELELTSVIVLALKADQQLSDVSGSRDLFDKCFFPWSMEQVINRLSKKERVVVLIDQIDALSLTLAHDEKALNLLIDMIAKLRRIPNVCILISCRLFDIHSDPRLNQIESGQRFDIKRLSKEEIRNALSLISFDCSHLSKATFELLTTPLHLSLFIQAIQSGWTDPNEIYGASSLQELYASIWRYVIFSPSIKTPSESERKETIDFITNYMDDEQTIIIPQSVLFEPEKQRLQKAINWLASIGIIAESKNGWTFFHQTFFDYCFARKFVEAGGNIVEEILKSPQGLIERSKLIQVFTYLRGYRNSAYLKQYDSLVASPVLRFHLQDLLIRWFGSIPNPYEAETNYFLHCILTQEKRNLYLTAMFGNLQWFAFMQSSILPKWLSSDDDEFIDTYVIPYLISMVEINQLRVVQLIAPFLEMGEKWQRRIYFLITRIQKWVCIEAAQLMVKLVEKPHVVHRHDWYEITNVAKAYPQIGCQLLNIAFNAALDEFAAKKQEAETDRKKSQYFSLSGILDQLDNVQIEDAIRVVSDAEPLLLLDIWIAWLDRYYSLLPISPKDSSRYSWDEFYEHWNEEIFRVRNAFIQSLISTTVTLATTNPDRFSKLAAKIALSPFATYQRLLARVYSLVPDRYAEQAFTFLISDARRLHLASFDCVESRRLIHVIYPYLDTNKRHKLETHIMNYDPIYKQLGIKALKIRGLDQLYLLEAIQPEMLSAFGRKRILELRHKFPKYKAVDDEPEMEGGAVGSPIPEVIARKMSDKNWLSAMQKYSKGVSHKDFLKGGSHELAGILTALVKESPTRFYALLQKVPDDIEDEYVTAFINGFSEITENPEWLFNTIRRFSPQPQRNIQLAITWAVEKTSNKIPQDIIALLEGLLRTPMGDDELWWSADKNHSDAFNNFLNSDRGAAFHALMRIWSKEKSNEALRKRWALVELAADDPSTTLRAGAVFWLTYLVHYDRNRAVSIFERLVTGHDILLTLVSTRECLYWSFYQNFLRLSPYIEKMMSNEAETVQEQGAQLACIAVLSPSALESPEAVEKAKNLAEVAVTGNVAWRRGAAKIFSNNLSHRPKDICESYLHSLLTDSDDQVRNHIDSIFHNLKGEHFLELRKFVEAYARSSKQLHTFFAEFLLTYGLLEPAWSLSIVRQTINNMEPKKQWHTGVEELIRLVIKIYMNPLSDETLRENAMDVFDILMERYSGYTLKILSEWDRQ